MNIYFSAIFDKKLKKIVKNNDLLKKNILKQLQLFQKHPYHPSLKIHKLKGKHCDQFAIWIQADLRALYIKDKNDIIFVDLINHDQY